MARYTHGYDSLTPQALIDGYQKAPGLRPGVKAALDLIDTTHPSWPSVLAVLREFTESGVGIDAATAAIAVKVGRQRWADLEEPFTATGVQATLTSAADSIVYYIRRGGFIKIGTTTAPRQRFRELRPDEILAVEPGGHKKEKVRHKQFAHLRVGGEYFQAGRELRSHVSRIRSLHGDPDPSWPTTTGGPKPWRLPRPASTVALTAAEAESELGIKEGTIRVWIHRGRIQIAGRDDQRRNMFYREHLIALRDSAHLR